MSFGRENKCICAVSNLDLFVAPMEQQSVDSSKTHYHRPLSSVESADIIEFVLAASEDYVDLSRTLLELKVRVVKVTASGAEEELTADEAKRVAPEKLFMHSIFSQLDIHLGDRVVSSSLNTYGYVAYLQTLLSFSSDSKHSYLTAAGWVGDAPASNRIDPVRSALIQPGKDIHLLGRLHADLFQQGRLLLPHLDMKIRLLKAPDAFALMHLPAVQPPAPKLDLRVKISECLLLVRKVCVNPDVAIAHERALEKSPARYPIRRSLVRYFPLSAGSLSATVDNITGPAPGLIVVGLVSSHACNGRLNLSPFAFEHHNVTRLACFYDGSPVPINPFTPDFEGKAYARSYVSLFQATGNYLSNDGIPGISYEDYVSKNYVLWGINLSQDDSLGDTHVNPARHGTLRLEFNFKTALSEALTAVIYFEYDNEVLVTAAREVIVDF